MVSTLGIALLCCAALTAAVPSPSLRPNHLPADFDIIVIQIDEPASSESSEREGSGIYDDILNQFFSFQLPEFPGFGRYFFDEDAGQPSAETEIERPETVKRQPEIAKRRPEVDDVRPETTMAPVTEVTTHFILTDGAGPATRSGYNFGLSNLLSSMMSSVLSGFVQALKQSPEMVNAKPEMLASSEEDQPEVARVTGGKPQDDLDEDLERKIERLFMENDEKDNDLKHGGAKKIPIPHEHQFFTAEKPRGALFPVIEHRVETSEAKSKPVEKNEPKLGKTEIPEPKLSPAQKNEPTWISGKLEFDRKIMELLSAMDDLPEPVSEDVSTASPSAKTARSVENFDSEEPVASERVVRENSNASVSPFDDQSTEAVPIFGESEEAEEASPETPASSEEQEHFYVPHGESPSPEVFPSTYMFLPRFEETRRSIPDLAAEVVLVPAPRPPRRYIPDFEHYSSLGHEILGYPSLGHGYPGSGYDYPSSAYDYPGLGHDFPSLGHDYSSIGHDYSSLGHDYRAVPAFGRSYASMADYARPAVPRFVAARSHPYADLLWPRRKMPMSYHPSLKYFDVAEPRPPMASQYFLL